MNSKFPKIFQPVILAFLSHLLQLLWPLSQILKIVFDLDCKLNQIVNDLLKSLDTSGAKLVPCIASGVSTPASSKNVGAKSTFKSKLAFLDFGFISFG